MLIHVFLSACMFIIFTLLWLCGYNDFTFIDTKSSGLLEKFSFNTVLILEQLKFITGIFISIYFFSLIASCFQSNLRYFLKEKLSYSLSITLTWLFITLSILSITSFIYPNIFFSHSAWTTPYLISFTLTILIFTLSLSFIIKKNRIKTIIIFSLVAGSIIPLKIDISIDGNRTNSKKNIIIIGIDSLNTNIINKKNTPFINNFISTSLYLPNTYTHVARSFPSWFTILTGKYPSSNKARLNLTNLKTLNLKETLPYVLKQYGYINYFSSDERRFCHIDESFHFDKVIGPSVTINELLLSHFVENPMLAITSQFPLFKYLTPQLYNNRASWKNYSPSSFNQELEFEIKNKGLPVFISSHFTLPHWPYKSIYNTSDHKDTYGKYVDSIKLADQQVHRYYEHLRNEGFLNNALVFIITDHGESFGRIIDQPINSNSSLNIPGHGNSIISKSQFNVLLALKEYRNGKEVNLKIKNRELKFALTDITPTILDILNIKVKNKFDGESIFRVKSERTIPLESSLKPSFNINGSINIEKTINNNINLYDIDEQGRAVLKNNYYSDLVKIKQRGVLFEKWQISIYPELNNSIFITDLEENYLHNFDEFENKEISKDLLRKLCSFFSDDEFDAKLKYCENEPYLLMNGNLNGKAI